MAEEAICVMSRPTRPKTPAAWLEVVSSIEASLGRAAAIRAGRIIWWDHVSSLPYRADHYGFSGLLDSSEASEVPEGVLRAALEIAFYSPKKARSRSKGPKSYEIQDKANHRPQGARRRKTDKGRCAKHSHHLVPSSMVAYAPVSSQEQNFRTQTGGEG